MNEVIMADKLVKLTLQSTLADDSGVSIDNTTEWTNLPYAAALLIEEKLVGILADLIEVGRAANTDIP
jgi:hypothetical protein